MTQSYHFNDISCSYRGAEMDEGGWWSSTAILRRLLRSPSYHSSLAVVHPFRAWSNHKVIDLPLSALWTISIVNVADIQMAVTQSQQIPAVMYRRHWRWQRWCRQMEPVAKSSWYYIIYFFQLKKIERVQFAFSYHSQSKATAWRLGFGFPPHQAEPKAATGRYLGPAWPGLFGLGLARLTAWGRAMHSTTAHLLPY
jgi:hypothetical protein